MEVNEHNASARGFNLALSKKFSVEVSKFIQGKDLKVAKAMMEDVLTQKIAVPFTRFNRDLGHKTGIGPGRYPMKVCKTFLNLLQSAEMNAVNKGLDVDALFVKSAFANKASGTMRGGRNRGREAKRCHIEIVLEEREIKKKAKKTVSKKEEVKKPEVKKENPLKEEKVVEKKPEGEKKE
tara:strand:- start:7765 stop:8304 length:540 start_codon:yes stop_codon:yes gene_type:complete